MLLVVAATERELAGAAGLDGVEVLACGVGPVDAAVAVAARLAREPKPSAVLHVGIAGARRNTDLQPGMLVVGGASTWHDTEHRLVSRELGPDPVLLAALHRAVPDAPVLDIGTSADVAGTDGCDVEAMEGFGVLRAADRAAVAAIEARVISNEVEESDRDKWYFDEAFAALDAALPILVAAIVSPHDDD